MRVRFVCVSTWPPRTLLSLIIIPHPPSFIPDRSSLIPHPSSLIPHRSSLIPRPSSLIAHHSLTYLLRCIWPPRGDLTRSHSDPRPPTTRPISPCDPPPAPPPTTLSTRGAAVDGYRHPRARLGIACRALSYGSPGGGWLGARGRRGHARRSGSAWSARPRARGHRLVASGRDGGSIAARSARGTHGAALQYEWCEGMNLSPTGRTCIMLRSDRFYMVPRRRRQGCSR